MIKQLMLKTTELTITPNPDGTHAVRVVEAGGDPWEFTCHMDPHLSVEIEIDTSPILALHSGIALVQERKIEARIRGHLTPKESSNWNMRVLRRDECGNDKP